MYKLLLLALITFYFSACQSSHNSASKDSRTTQENTEQKSGDYYNSPEIGWEMEIPTGWEILAKDEIAPPDPDNVSETALVLKRLLSLEKGQDNQFHATIEEYNTEKQKDWSGINQTLKSMIYAQIARNEEITADSSQTTIAEIDGQKFETFSLTINSPSGDVLLYQTLYFALINNFNFNVFIISNNTEDEATLLTTFKASQFTEPMPFESIERPKKPEVKKHSPYRDSIQSLLDVVRVNLNTDAELVKDNKNYFYYKLDNGLDLLTVKWSQERNQYEESFALLNGKLVYAFELQDYFKSKTDIGQSWNCRYFIKDQKIIEHETLGMRKSDTPEWNPNSIFEVWAGYKATFEEMKK